MTWVDDMSMTPERIGARELVSGLSSDSSSWQGPGHAHLAEMLTVMQVQGFPNARRQSQTRPGRFEFNSKCDVAELGIGIGRDVRIAIVTVIIIFPFPGTDSDAI